MNDFTMGAAIDLFEKGVEHAKANNLYSEDDLQKLIQHSFMVAACSEILSANIPEIDTEKAYALGLLHDYGKFLNKDNEKSFHAIHGYWAMKRQAWDLPANICITHTFPENNLVLQDYFSYGEDNIKEAAELLGNIEYNDYSRLIQLTDIIAYMICFDTVKERMIYIKNTYNADISVIKRKYKNAMKLKHYFDKKCGCDIYDLLGIKK